VIVGLGIDLIDSARVRRELSRGAWVPEDGIFTESEILQRSSGRGHAALGYAACFAAKEAALKALGMEVKSLACFREVELLSDSDHNLTLKLNGQAQAASRTLGVQRAFVAVTATERMSGAMVVLESQIFSRRQE